MDVAVKVVAQKKNCVDGSRTVPGFFSHRPCNFPLPFGPSAPIAQGKQIDVSSSIWNRCRSNNRRRFEQTMETCRCENETDRYCS